jgi:hypothetical protein
MLETTPLAQALHTRIEDTIGITPAATILMGSAEVLIRIRGCRTTTMNNLGLSGQV